jgi:hypothetical protein
MNKFGQYGLHFNETFKSYYQIYTAPKMKTMKRNISTKFYGYGWLCAG